MDDEEEQGEGEPSISGDDDEDEDEDEDDLSPLPPLVLKAAFPWLFSSVPIDEGVCVFFCL
jgi:hypothetical protein